MLKAPVIYNLMVLGIHNYYRYATAVSVDCQRIQFRISVIMYNRFRNVLKKQGRPGLKFVWEQYGKSKMLRWMFDVPICPIGYVQTRNPMYKKKKICRYTPEGREAIHKNLKFEKKRDNGTSYACRTNEQ